MVNYRIESSPRRFLEKSQYIDQTKKTIVWSVPGNPDKVVKIRKPNYWRSFSSPDKVIEEIVHKDIERLIIVDYLKSQGSIHPEEAIIKNEYVIYPRSESTYDYDVEQPRVHGKNLEQLGLKTLNESPEVIREVGRLLQAHIKLVRNNQAIDVLGSLWPNDYSRVTRLIRPYLPIFFSKNIMIGELNGTKDAFLVDPDLINLTSSNQESLIQARKTIIGSYITLLLISAKK